MCSLSSVIIMFCLLTSVTIARKSKEPESIGFPEPEEDPALTNKDNRQPVFLPSLCPENELYYPGDQKDDWICDCRPAHLYHPKTDKCWPAYRKGPCNNGYYLILGAESAIPFCEINPCFSDNSVMFNGKCEMLGAVTPCNSVWPHFEFLTINSTTLTTACEPLNFDTRFKDKPITYANLSPCPAGSKRSINGKCGPTSTTTTT